MIQSPTMAVAAVGACLQCKVLFFVGPDTPNCLGCGRPPDRRLFFPDVGGAEVIPLAPTPDASAPPAEPPTIYVACPECGRDLAVTIGEDAIDVDVVAPAEIRTELDAASEPDAEIQPAPSPEADDGEPEPSSPASPAPPPAANVAPVPEPWEGRMTEPAAEVGHTDEPAEDQEEAP